MNITDLIHDIKISLGLNTIALPFNVPVENFIQEAITVSIRTYSQFKPYTREAYEIKDNLRAANDIEKSANIFYLPESLTRTPVFSASAECTTATYKNGDIVSNAFTIGSPFVGFGSYYPQDIMNATSTGAAINKYAGITSQVPTTKWLGYNKIQLYNFPDNTVIHFKVKCEHDPSCETIELPCYETFKDLAMLDTKIILYNNLLQMTNVGSAFKEIQVKIDQWSGAEDKREALVKEWTESFHIDEVEDLVMFF